MQGCAHLPCLGCCKNLGANAWALLQAGRGIPSNDGFRCGTLCKTQVEGGSPEEEDDDGDDKVPVALRDRGVSLSCYNAGPYFMVQIIMRVPIQISATLGRGI